MRCLSIPLKPLLAASGEKGLWKFGNSRNPDSDPEDLAKMSKSTCSGKMKRIATCSIKIGDVPECIKRYPKPCSAIQVLVNVKWLTDKYDKYYPLQPPSPLCTFKNMVGPQERLVNLGNQKIMVFHDDFFLGVSVFFSIFRWSSAPVIQWPALLAILGPSIGFWSSPAVEFRRWWRKTPA